MTVFDSVKKEKCLFEPLVAGKVSLYVCGPTVYDDAHLGHARSALAFDLLFRVLKESGYEVTYVKNITDIDDKIITKMAQTHQTLEALTTYYIARYHEEMDALNILRPTLEPKATNYITQMTAMIEKLLSSGHAYQTPDGTVYFDATKDSRYFSLSHRNIQEEARQSRLETAHGKRHPSDFAMWKPSKGNDDVAFATTLGAGRPGWHIECSAMIEALFPAHENYTIDIHAGGADLLFPHHENEAAQSRCATGRELAKYWMHNGFVTIDGEKMSKSLGNSFFLKNALSLYHGEVLRYYLLTTHYRADFNFSEVDLQAAKKRLDKLFRLKKRVYDMKPTAQKTPFQTRLIEALHDDLNTSKAFAVLDECIAYYNEQLDAKPSDKALKAHLLADLDFVERVLGIGTCDAFEYFQFGLDTQTLETIAQLIEARTLAKQAKDFAQADRLRETLLGMGVSIMDTAQGTKWEKL